jgi:hypothetical protein
MFSAPGQNQRDDRDFSAFMRGTVTRDCRIERNGTVYKNTIFSLKNTYYWPKRRVGPFSSSPLAGHLVLEPQMLSLLLLLLPPLLEVGQVADVFGHVVMVDVVDILVVVMVVVMVAVVDS